jgi:hypothetical protein
MPRQWNSLFVQDDLFVLGSEAATLARVGLPIWPSSTSLPPNPGAAPANSAHKAVLRARASTQFDGSGRRRAYPLGDSLHLCVGGEPHATLR